MSLPLPLQRVQRSHKWVRSKARFSAACRLPRHARRHLAVRLAACSVWMVLSQRKKASVPVLTDSEVCRAVLCRSAVETQWAAIPPAEAQ
jgi:hypothetical protein